jgi:hypothetical protein
MGEDPAVYFFVGRPFPSRNGNTALSIRFADLDSHNVRASPFDTGGLIAGHSRLPWAQYALTKEDYVADHTVTMTTCAEYFSRHLAAFFTAPSDYWNLPSWAIDGVVFNPGDDWRDWTFEVRSASNVGLTNASWYVTTEVDSYLQKLVLGGLVSFVPTSYDVVNKPFAVAESHARESAVGNLK